jgi:antitoxin ParD1/3/4
MRTNIEIDDKLMHAAMRAGGFKTKKDTVAAALKLLAQQRDAYRRLRDLSGKLMWEGDLAEMRRDRSSGRS